MRSYPTKKKCIYFKVPWLLEMRGEPRLCAGAGAAVHAAARRRRAGQAPWGAATLLDASAQPGCFWMKPAKAQLFNPTYCHSAWRCTPRLGCPGACRCGSSHTKPAVLKGWWQHLRDGEGNLQRLLRRWINVTGYICLAPGNIVLPRT